MFFLILTRLFCGQKHIINIVNHKYFKPEVQFTHKFKRKRLLSEYQFGKHGDWFTRLKRFFESQKLGMSK